MNMYECLSLLLHTLVQITNSESDQAAVKQAEHRSLCGVIMRHSSVPKWDQHAYDKEVQMMSVCCAAVRDSSTGMKHPDRSDTNG